MHEPESNEEGAITFFKNAIIRPKENIIGNANLSVMINMGLVFFMFIITVLLLYIAYIFISYMTRGFENYAYMGILVVYVGLFAFLLLIPLIMVNLYVIYLINQKFSNEKADFKKVFSDHTTILIPVFLLYSIGLFFYSLVETSQPYLMLGGGLLILLSIIMYVRRSIKLVKYYVKDSGSKISYVYAAILIVTVILILPIFINYVNEGFFEQLLRGIRVLLQDLGLL